MADDVESEKKPAKPAATKAGRKKTSGGAGAKRASSASSTRKASAGASAKPPASDSPSEEAGQTSSAAEPDGNAGVPPTNSKPSGDSDLIEKLWRLVAMIAFGLIGFFAYHAVAVVALVQFIVVLIREEPNKDLQQAALWLNAYLNQVLDYLAYRTEEMPFPLGEKPSSPNV